VYQNSTTLVSKTVTFSVNCNTYKHWDLAIWR